MNIRLTPHSEQILREQLTHGNFRSPEEVIERALQARAINGRGEVQTAEEKAPGPEGATGYHRVEVEVSFKTRS